MRRPSGVDEGTSLDFQEFYPAGRRKIRARGANPTLNLRYLDRAAMQRLLPESATPRLRRASFATASAAISDPLVNARSSREYVNPGCPIL
jgi:hypothetical protein